MSYKSFPAPVKIIIRQSPENIIATVWEALEFLRSWPGKRNRAYRLALQTCLDALDGMKSPRKAHAAFTAAARDAGILA